jgi:hypothetical protein
MTKKDIKKRCDECIKEYLAEFHSNVDEAKDITMRLQIYCYFGDVLTEKDLIKCGDYLGFELNIKSINEGKTKFLDEFKEEKKQKQRQYYSKGGKVYVKN